MPMSDEALLAAVQRGDTEALEQLYLRHHRALFAFLARITGDRLQAEDVLHEIFLKLLRNRRSEPVSGAVLPWLFRIARNAAIDQYRRAQRVVEVAFSEAESASAPFTDDDPLEQRQVQLEWALAQLPEALRTPLVLRGVHQMEYADLATALDCTEGAARVRVHRATVAVRKLIAEKDDEQVAS